ncbi:LAGLIDADG family homing endonuclease [Rhizohabitans arisaemae]|uniref:LAGLIDADG family homing endonuclease n=1 Tax=Rhizohabitans arisaemae TaxID=2720610 RepID=UPI0024B1A88C|nr:LAGLIDADG family homing endonuclease [Rhizohabitans arisaemae]
MAKFNRRAAKTAVTSPVVTESMPSTRTYEGAPGYLRSTKGELFLLAVTNMVGEQTFYEKADKRDNRFRYLVRQVAVEDVGWLAGFLPWLRDEANMRSAPIAAALEAVQVRLAAGLTGMNRQLVDSVLQRADEPGEALAYWHSRFGRTVPKPVKRGIADAVRRLYNERSLLKYDTDSRGWRFGDVIDLVHPSPDDAKSRWQGDLFAHALDRRHGRDKPIPETLRLLRDRADLFALPVEQRRSVLSEPERLGRAGVTWEALAGWLQGPMDAEAWTAMIPSMGYMACLAEGTPVWLPDGTTAPIEEVVARKLPVLSYDKAWDTRPVKYGANQGPRNHSVGALGPTTPTAWLDTGVRPVATIRFVSGRTIEATYDHRWIRQRRGGRQAWEWTTTGDLRVGDRIPVPLTASQFGEEGDAWDGYFVGAMLGDGGMTALTPEFHGNPDDGAVAFMREYVVKHGCRVTETPNGSIVRLRFPFKQWKLNPLTEVLRRYDVWGKRCEVKSLPNRPFSREFWIGAISGLIDTDGCVRERVNAKGTAHGSVEYATVSRRLAQQVSDALLRLGVTSIVRERAVKTSTSTLDGGRTITSRLALFVVEVNRATALVKLSELLDLRISYKAASLARLAEKLRHVAPARSEMHGYDESIALDRVAAIEDGGERATYCVTVEASNLFIADGLVTGNCLRNLRNFDQAGVGDETAGEVITRLTDPDEVARSRQFPFRFYSAYRNAPSERWHDALDRALALATGSVPALPGRTLVLVDTSASMTAGQVSARSTVSAAQAAALFGVVLASRATKVDLHGFADGVFHHRFDAGASPLREINRFCERIGEVGHGTRIAEAIKATYRKHDRVILLSDMQTFPYLGESVDRAVPQDVPIYSFNLCGYQQAAMQTGKANRHEFGGFSDACFRLIPLLERGRNAGWPWQ